MTSWWPNGWRANAVRGLLGSLLCAVLGSAIFLAGLKAGSAMPPATTKRLAVLEYRVGCVARENTNLKLRLTLVESELRSVSEKQLGFQRWAVATQELLKAVVAAVQDIYARMGVLFEGV